jgi:hypothetical protein
MAGKGTGYFAKRQRERQAQFSNPYLFLRDNDDQARIRFLEEPKEGLFSGVFHRPFTKGKLQNPVVCVEQDNDTPTVEGMAEDCPLCATEDSPGLKFFLWVYVYHILHPNQNPALEKDASAPKWQAVKVGKGESSRTMFKQDVNKVKVLLGGPRLKDLLDEVEQAAAEEGENLLVSDYKFIRHGSRGDSDTTYVFRAVKNSSKLKKEVKEAIDKLGDITDIAMEGTLAFYAGDASVDAPEEPEEEPEEEEEATEAEESEEAEEADGEEEPSAESKEFATL